jgi:hypothetical protein
MAHGLAHAPHLSVTPLVDHDPQHTVAIVAHDADPRRRARTILQVDPVAQKTQGCSARNALHLGEVLLLHPERRMGETLGKFPVVRHQQEAFGVRVQPAHGEHPRVVGNELGDRRPALWIVSRGQHTSWLVEEVMDETGEHTDPHAVDGDTVAGHVHPPPERGELFVHRDAPR